MRQIEQLRGENESLRERLGKQEQKLDAVLAEVSELKAGPNGPERGDSRMANEPLMTSGPAKVLLSGRGAAAWFSSESDGAYPNSEFILDELRLDLDARILENVYAFTEVNFATREAQDLYTELGEAYVDFEGISRLWGDEKMLSLRVGRLDVPFGEEYLSRDAIDNPLISHSLTDFWGIDEGIETYGGLGPVHYVLAVQNGGNHDTHDYSGDKSLALRLGYDPAKWLHLGVSGLRTGDLNAAKEWSALWFGNGFFRSIGSAGTTKFNVNTVQGDVRFKLPRGHLHVAGGMARYDDNDPLSGNRRDLFFYSAEAVHDVTHGFYGGVRFSQIFVDQGYPIVGQGNFGEYFFGPMTDEIWRLSLGVGYQFSESLVLKGEYSIERGHLIDGGKRSNQDMVAGQVAFKF